MHNFHKHTLQDKQKIVSEFCKLNTDEIKTLNTPDPQKYDSLIENVIGTYVLPIGVATNFKINSKKYLIPMVTEEPSIIAAASSGAKAVIGDIVTSNSDSYIIGQIQIINPDSDAKGQIKKNMKNIHAEINKFLSKHMRCLSVEYEDIAIPMDNPDIPKMGKVEIKIDAGNAMGANAVNTVCEGMSPLIQSITGGRVLLRILSNARSQFVRAEATFNVDKQVAKDILLAYQFALVDSNRAITHNKGIMNGISSVAMATGQDTRAIEASAHLHAVQHGRYEPLTTWRITQQGLLGVIELPIPVGVVGGMTKHHDTATIALKMLGNPNAYHLAEIMAAVGLCQNFAALRALCVDGIQKGHMKLHSRRQVQS